MRAQVSEHFSRLGPRFKDLSDGLYIILRAQVRNWFRSPSGVKISWLTCFQGSVKLVALPKRQKGLPKPTRKPVTLDSTNAARALNNGDYDLASHWFPCREIITAALDECNKGSWVFAKSPITVSRACAQYFYADSSKFPGQPYHRSNRRDPR